MDLLEKQNAIWSYNPYLCWLGGWLPGGQVRSRQVVGAAQLATSLLSFMYRYLPTYIINTMNKTSLDISVNADREYKENLASIQVLNECCLKKVRNPYMPLSISPRCQVFHGQTPPQTFLLIFFCYPLLDREFQAASRCCNSGGRVTTYSAAFIPSGGRTHRYLRPIQ